MRPKFSFLADLSDPLEKAGTATWTYEGWDKGDWEEKSTSIGFSSFDDAWSINDIITQAYDRGEAEGYHNAKLAVYKVLG